MHMVDTKGASKAIRHAQKAAKQRRLSEQPLSPGSPGPKDVRDGVRGGVEAWSLQ